jgi:transcriptional regulator with XRE-family HTH domain
MRGMEVQLTPRPSRHAARFPNTIREYRLKAGLSQRKLAAMLGRSKDAVSSWERGLNLPSVPLLMRMAKILDTLAEALYRDYYQRFPQSQENTDATAA